jgi:hypothetical protein
MEQSQALASPVSASPCAGCGQPTDVVRCPLCGVAQQVGSYVVERVLAQGPHARVYVARDASGRLVALKEIQFSTVPSVLELDAFEREAEALRSLHHPSIPRYIDCLREGQGVGLRLYLASEFVAGETLAARIQRAPLSGSEALVLAQRLLDILDYLHGRSPPVLHRDVKPANVVLRPDGTVALVDFGSVRALSADRTHGSTLVGTFGYVPPEQLGGTVDRTSDLYALGATLLHALTGKPPVEWLAPSLEIRIPDRLPEPFGHWLPRLLARDPALRPPDVAAARRALERRQPLPETKLRVGLAIGVGLAGAAVVAVAALAIARVSLPRALPHLVQPSAASAPRPNLSSGRAWLERVRPHCNAVEATQALARNPPPAGAEGTGAGAACLALAGKSEAARRMIRGLPEEQRVQAAAVVFDAGHPVADMGDDVSAAPIMTLVLEFWPDNFQALYHAGMSEYALGRPAEALPLLQRFMQLYQPNDYFKQSAIRAMERIAEGMPPEPGQHGEH